MRSNEQYWWIITLTETNHASGDFIFELLDYMHKRTNINYIVIGNIEGLAVSKLAKDRSYSSYSYNQLMPLIHMVKQFYWCDLFCYEEKDEIPISNLWSVSYPEIIANTLVSIRIVDFNDIEIYLRSTILYQSIKRNYNIARYYKGLLKNHIFLE